MSDQPHVVVVGGGFGGLQAAKHLADLPVDVTLIDRRNHHLFQPLLYQVATAGLNPADIAQPIRSILRGQKNLDIVLAEVEDIDPTGPAPYVELADQRRIEYDYLIVAAGARHAYFGNDEWEEVAPGLKSVEDAIEIRRRVLGSFERADQATDPAVRNASMTFVVVGAGPTGVEMAGAVAEIARYTLARDFRHIDTTATTVVLVEGADRVLHTFDPTLSESALRGLETLGVTVRLNTMVKSVDELGVDIEGPGGAERVEAHTVLWAAGVAASQLGARLAAHAGIEVDRAGRVPVDGSLAVPGLDRVFVIGDMAAATSDGKPVPGVAPAATQGAEIAVKSIRADLDGAPRPTFRYLDKGSLATIGRSRAVAEFGPIRFAGFIAWVLWWAVHIALLVGFPNRVAVMASWGWNWLTYKRGARLITSRWRPGAKLDWPPDVTEAMRARSER